MLYEPWNDLRASPVESSVSQFPAFSWSLCSWRSSAGEVRRLFQGLLYRPVRPVLSLARRDRISWWSMPRISFYYLH